MRATIAVLALVGALMVPGSAAAAAPAMRSAVVVVVVAASCPTGGAATTPARAVSLSAAHAGAAGVGQAISVLDRTSGKLLGSTANANSQVASESIMKLLLASYYLVLYGGYQKTPSDVKTRLSYMLRYSDDATASSLFSANAIPTIAGRYGLSRTTNATDRAGHWGAARITARDMTQFLYRAQKDSAVGPWLIPVMAQTAANGSDGFNQKFGLNALTGTRGSKQGWGADSFFTAQPYAIHSVGYTKHYFVAVLQTGPGGTYPDPMRSTATYTARAVQAADAASGAAGAASGSGSAGLLGAPGPAAAATVAAAVKDGTFVKVSGKAEVYRIAGGAPLYISSWSIFGGRQPVTTLTQSGFDALRTHPVEGTFLRARPSGRVYRVAGGAPIYLRSWSTVGGEHGAVDVDAATISHAGTATRYRQLLARPADGTFVRSYNGGRVYRFAGGAPMPVTSWARVGGEHGAVYVDAAAADNAGTSRWANLSKFPAAGTFLRAYATGRVYRVAGGAPIAVPAWSCLGVRAQPTVVVDAAVIANGGRGGLWRHLLFYPRDGTFLKAYPGGRVYRTSGGVPLPITSWARYGGPQPTVLVPQVSVDRAGSGEPYAHLRAS